MSQRPLPVVALALVMLLACNAPQYSCDVEGATGERCECADGEHVERASRVASCVPDETSEIVSRDAKVDAAPVTRDASDEASPEAHDAEVLDAQGPPPSSMDVGPPVVVDPNCVPSTEICNAMDDDCDQLVDEDVVCGARKVSAKGNYTCFVRDYGTAYCWGQNMFGQLGDGTTERRPTPVPILAQDIASIAAGITHTCVIAKSGVVSCWGRKTAGQLGDGASFPAPTEPQFRATPAEILLPTTARDIASGANHSCAILDDNRVFCWGANDGTFGAGPGPASSTPVAVSGLPSDVAMIVAGYNHTCTLLFDGTIMCWGKNNLGQLGVGDQAQYDRPMAVPGLSSIINLAADDNHTCALHLEGTVHCWGHHVWNDTVTTSPEAVPGVTRAVVVAAGFDHDCAIGTTSTQCWGANRLGQLGNGSKRDSAEPVKVIGLPWPIALDLGSAHSCASTLEGPVECWGSGAEGELGDGSLLDAVAAIPANLPP